ncbi:MAG: hypothetical protein JO036_12330 [Candidatus Eremiobacteraeota bacterium]|nr:hypothetical protein [Candidatus Eremiobacteraeota bacterium]
MRSLGIGFAAALFVCSAAVPAAAADAPADLVCPRAVPKLVAFHDASATKDLAKILPAVREAADAYLTCLSEAKTRTYEEPYMNYDRTRAAQFLVVEGRVLALRGDTKSAVAVLEDAHDLAQQVVTWLPMSQTYIQSSNVHVGNSATRSTDRDGSRYQAEAKAVLAAADDELVKLDATPRRQASASPSPAPSHSP